MDRELLQAIEYVEGLRWRNGTADRHAVLNFLVVVQRELKRLYQDTGYNALEVSALDLVKHYVEAAGWTAASDRPEG